MLGQPVVAKPQMLPEDTPNPSREAWVACKLPFLHSLPNCCRGGFTYWRYQGAGSGIDPCLADPIHLAPFDLRQNGLLSEPSPVLCLCGRALSVMFGLKIFVH